MLGDDTMIEKIQKDFIEAMKNKEKERLDVIKMLKASIQNEEIKKKESLTDEEIISIVTKQVKMRKDAIEDFKKASRDDLIKSYESEIEILNKYLPEALSDEEVLNIINEAFDTINPTSQKDMGLIMKEVNPKLKGRCDMGNVSKIIKDKLSNL